MTAATTPGADPTNRMHAVRRRLARNRPESRSLPIAGDGRLLEARLRLPAARSPDTVGAALRPTFYREDMIGEARELSCLP